MNQKTQPFLIVDENLFAHDEKCFGCRRARRDSERCRQGLELLANKILMDAGDHDLAYPPRFHGVTYYDDDRDYELPRDRPWIGRGLCE